MVHRRMILGPLKLKCENHPHDRKGGGSCCFNSVLPGREPYFMGHFKSFFTTDLLWSGSRGSPDSWHRDSLTSGRSHTPDLYFSPGLLDGPLVRYITLASLTRLVSTFSSMPPPSRSQHSSANTVVESDIIPYVRKAGPRSK
jgi:hypothetical protein